MLQIDDEVPKTVLICRKDRIERRQGQLKVVLNKRHPNHMGRNNKEVGRRL